MVRPRPAQRGALLLDLLCALALAAVAIAVAAGIGVVGFFAALTALALALWVTVEAGVRWALRARRRRSTGFASGSR
jgi:hypothetical protein